MNAERADVIAYLEQRRDKAVTMLEGWPDFANDGRVMRRQIELILGDLKAGMHEGAAGVRAALTQGKPA